MTFQSAVVGLIAQRRRLFGLWFMLAALAAALLVTSAASAVPAVPGAKVDLRQPDGTKFTAELWGDEWYNGLEVDGYTILVDAKTKWWKYAEPTPDGKRLQPGKNRVGKEKPDTQRHLRDKTKVASAKQKSDARVKQFQSDLGDGPTIQGPKYQNTGVDRSLVILAQFSNSAGTTTVASWQSRFFGATNSVMDYYDEVSYGAFTLSPAAETALPANDGIVGWVTLAMQHPNQTDSKPTVAAAIRAADPYVNYASFDTNGDRKLQPNELHITVIAAGFEAATTCGNPAVWAHQWQLGSSAPTVDGVTAGYDGFTIFGEKQCNGGVHQATIGVIAHEFGHDIGWPDEYDIDKTPAEAVSNGGVGYWSLMAAGTWNAVSGYQGTSPAHPDAFLKSYQGWLTPTLTSGTMTGVQIQQASTTASVRQFLANPNGVDWSFEVNAGTGEYFLVENRQKNGYDQALPGCGLLIWHIDETRTYTNSANATNTRRLVQLLDADGNNYQFNAADAWTGAKTFSDSTTPSAKLYSGAASGVRLSNFSACGATMTLDSGSPSAIPNDSFGSATAVGAFPYTQTGLATGSATIQTSEPSPSCSSLGKTVWYRFTAGADLKVTATTSGSNFDTVLAAWRGTSIGALTEVGCNDNSGASGGPSQISFTVQSGQTYYVQAGGWGDQTHPPVSGNLSISLTAVSAGIANDSFGGATTMGSFPFAVTGLNTTGATVQASEPLPTCGGIGRTVWYRFTPTNPVNVTFSTSGSNFDTVVQAWSGTALTALAAVACNDDFAGAGGFSQVAFSAAAGQTYYLQVGAFKDATTLAVGGSLNVSASVTSSGPANDAFASATNVAALPFSQAGLANGSASNQASEPAPTCATIGKTVWYRYTPVADTTVTASTAGSNFDTVLQAWKGTTIGGLTAQACSDDVADPGGTSSVQFAALAGETYYFQVGGFASTADVASGNLTFSLSGVPTGVANDAFSKATVVTALPFTRTGVATGSATTEAGEPEGACGGSIGKTIWYRWTPASNTTITVSTEGSNFDTVLGVWRGTAIGALTEMGCNDDFAGTGGYSKLQVPVVAGQTYFIQAGGYADASNPPVGGALSLSVITP